MREVYKRWEGDEREPVVSEWPDILRFLGYYPFEEQTPVDLVLKARRCQGVDQKTLARTFGVIHQRLRLWEHGSEIPDKGAMDHLARLARLPGAMLSTEATRPDPSLSLIAGAYQKGSVI